MSVHSAEGMSSFVEKHNLWSDENFTVAEEALKVVLKKKLSTVRLSFPDQHGILRGKVIPARDLPQMMLSGCGMPTSLLLKDTSHKTVFPIWQSGAGIGIGEFTGAGDFIMVPDPNTFRVLPWAKESGWMMCDIYYPDGRALPFSTRQICRNAVDKLSNMGFDYLCGLEVEFYLFKLDDDNQVDSKTSPLAHGFQYLTEIRYDRLEPALEIVRQCAEDLQLPVRSIESEFGPGQCEMTFHPEKGITQADNMVIFRNAVKQVCRRNGYHATFMSRPALPEIASNGWHLHQSLIEQTSGKNALIPRDDEEVLSPLGRQFVAGILEHAPASCVFSTPTINGYKRYAPETLAPDRIVWGKDNRGAMVRVCGGVGDNATRIENRIGEPAANPYLFLASQLLSGIDGIERKIEPAMPVDKPYSDSLPALPHSLEAAVNALKQSSFYRQALGDTFVDYIIRIKSAEINRFNAQVTDWEQREYFELF